MGFLGDMCGPGPSWELLRKLRGGAARSPSGGLGFCFLPGPVPGALESKALEFLSVISHVPSCAHEGTQLWGQHTQ